MIGAPVNANVTSNTNLVHGNIYFINTAAPRTLTLPVPSAGIYIQIKDSVGDAATNNITIAPNGSEKIEGVAASYTINSNYASVIVVCDGTNWYFLSPQSQLSLLAPIASPTFTGTVTLPILTSTTINNSGTINGAKLNITGTAGVGVSATTTDALKILAAAPASVGTTPGTTGLAGVTVFAGTGGNTTIATTGVGGTGGGTTLAGGIGGQATAALTSATAGSGGISKLSGGAGGASTTSGATLNTGGAGGQASLISGTGGAASGGTTNVGGVGGTTIVAGGLGGVGDVGANGGDIQIRGGQGASAGTPGTGGNIIFQTAATTSLSTRFTIDPNGIGTYAGDFKLSTAGKKFFVTEGSNAAMGTSALSAGSVTVSTTAVTANSRIFVTSQADGGTPGWLRITAKTAGTSFVITSSNASDTSTVAWIIIDKN